MPKEELGILFFVFLCYFVLNVIKFIPKNRNSFL